MYSCKTEFISCFGFFSDEEMLLMRKELCKAKSGVPVAAGPPEVESQRVPSTSPPLFF